MDSLFSKPVISKFSVDSRIFLSSFINNLGERETYPMGSFVFDLLLTTNQKALSVSTLSQCSPNTFVTFCTNTTKLKQMQVPLSPIGSYNKFYFYETCSWVHNNKYNRALHYVNYSLNIKWISVVSGTANKTKSITAIYKSAV